MRPAGSRPALNRLTDLARTRAIRQPVPVPVPRDGFGPDVIEPTRVEWPIGG